MDNTQQSGYNKRPLWQWVVIYLIIAIIIYGGIYYFFLAKKGGYTTSQNMYVPSAISPTTAMQGAAPSDNIYKTKTDPAKGTYLTDFQGMTLYVFDKDTTGVSNCYQGCATVWPAYSSGATAQSQFPANISVITRTDGSKQFAWKGKPLYYYSGDKNPGDTNGDGIANIWHIVKL